MRTLLPHPKLLVIWRAMLALAALPVAFLCALALRRGSLAWWAATAVWMGGFVLCWCWYLPARLRALRLDVDDDRFLLRTGVLRQVKLAMPGANIQLLALRSSPLHRRYGLASLIIIAPGSRMRMPGLPEAEARKLANGFFHSAK